jgi:hypothetical protein
LLDFENIVEATGSYLEPMHELKHASRWATRL